MRHLLLTLLLCGSITASARLLDRPQYLHPSTTVVGLYDSTDPGNRGHEKILPEVSAALRKLGLSLVEYDLKNGPPAAEVMADARAIVTAFTDVGMVDPVGYISWLEQQLESGKRLVILGNFGAYQSLDTKEWVDFGELNRVFRRLGVSFGGNWTDQVGLLKVDSVDSAMVPTVDLAAAAHYQWVRITDPAVVPRLVISRSDAANSASAVVFTSPSGGMALEQYFEDSSGKALVALPQLLRSALLDPAARRSDRILAITEPDYAFGRRMENNLTWLGRYARLQIDYVSVAEVRRLMREDLLPYGAVVLATDKATDLPASAARMLETWVREDGGGLVVALPNFRPDWKKLLGVTAWSEDSHNIKSITYQKGLYPGVDGMVVADEPGANKEVEPIASVHRLSVAADVTVLARATDDQTPVLWSHRYGKGRVLARNDQAMTDKVYRGQLLQLIMMSQPVAASPLVNAGVYFLDDCPQPMWDVTKQPIKSEFGLSDTDFYRDVWWPDMKQLSADFGLKYTFVLVFSYDDATKGGFTADPFYADVGKNVPEAIAREAVTLGHEIGLHGYNHQSLVSQKGPTSVGWPSRESMAASLRLAREEWARLFGPGNMPFTYIAPNNHIHRAGKEALISVFPETKVLATSYLDDDDVEGGEWDSDPDVPSLMGMPRVSSEFYLGVHNNVPFHDGIMLAGLWTHFAHPDDVYDPERNGGMGWKQLSVRQREMFQHLRDSYPWLRSLTSRDAFHDLVRFRADPFEVETTDSEVVFHLGAGATTRWAQVRVEPNRNVQSTETATIRQSYPEHGLHIVELRGPVARLTLGPAAVAGAPQR